MTTKTVQIEFANSGWKAVNFIQEAKSDGYKQMIIECQNNNVPACKFYHKQGALLSKIDTYAYYHEEACKDEVQFIWYLDLDK